MLDDDLSSVQQDFSDVTFRDHNPIWWPSLDTGEGGVLPLLDSPEALNLVILEVSFPSLPACQCRECIRQVVTKRWSRPRDCPVRILLCSRGRTWEWGSQGQKMQKNSELGLCQIIASFLMSYNFASPHYVRLRQDITRLVKRHNCAPTWILWFWQLKQMWIPSTC